MRETYHGKTGVETDDEINRAVDFVARGEMSLHLGFPCDYGILLG